MTTEHDRITRTEPTMAAVEEFAPPVAGHPTRDDAAPSPEPGEHGPDSLFEQTDLDQLRTQWQQVQGSFVDSPHDAVAAADALVTRTIEQLTTTYVQQRAALNDRWSHDQNGDTENLRQALHGYRSLFDKLLKA